MQKRDLQKVIDRCGEDFVAKRLQIQVEHSAKVLGPGLGYFHLENLDWLLQVLGGIIKLCGGWERGFLNIKSQRIVFNRVEIARLPKTFNGLRILHLSDLHLDVFEGMGTHVGRLCSTLECDIALITGDYRYHTHGNYYPVFREIEALAKFLDCKYGCYGILGNHDFLEFVPQLEVNGIKILLNESVAVTKDGEQFFVIGLDDAHFYGLQNYDAGFSQVPERATKILMIHSPETLEDAYNYGTDFVVSGHTHGGQVCLPGGMPLWLNTNCPGKYCRGRWDYRGMLGYTSNGTGSSGLPLRFNCPPEIVVHTLVNGEGSES
jgi:uncharacterized protein